MTLALTTPRGRPDGVAFLGGWVAGVAGVVTAVYLLASSLDLSHGSPASHTIGAVQIGLGVVLVAEGMRRLTTRRRELGTASWVTAFDRVGTAVAACLGFALAALNPKNFGLTTGAAVDIARADLTGPTAAAWLAGFTLIACATVALPVAYTFARARSAGASLGRWRAWLERHGDSLLIAILVIIGVVFLVQGFREFR